VIGVVVRVVKLNEEGRGLDAVIAWVATVGASRPGEVNIPSRLINLGYPGCAELVRHVACVFFDFALGGEGQAEN